LLSSVAEASSQSGSQRRFARDVSASSVFYLVYESAGKIWLTYTTNGGTSWQPERFIEAGTRPSLAPRDNGVALAYTVTDGEYAEVRVQLFSLSGNTLSQTAYLYNSSDWNAIPTASPAIVWLGNTFSQNPVLNNLPRYAVVYEAPATQGGTELARGHCHRQSLISLANDAEQQPCNACQFATLSGNRRRDSKHELRAAKRSSTARLSSAVKFRRVTSLSAVDL
jgi:hypothetical protein